MEPLSRLDSINDASGGTAIVGDAFSSDIQVRTAYQQSIKELDRLAFWTAGATKYRPSKGLWAPQRKAVALGLAYLASQRIRPDLNPETGRESALIKMPTGTGKTGVIATLACCAPALKRIVILTPRVALIEQMLKDLSWRFWVRFGYCYVDGILRDRSSVDAERLKRIENGKENDLHQLNEKGYPTIWTTRGSTRQIIVGSFNALHGVLGIEPPAHRSMYGREPREPAASLAACDEDGDEQKGIKNFRSLLRDTDLLMVDEGHYEPAYSWAQCVDSLNVPTILFSATPYRNDYKYFNVLGNFAFNLSFEEAADNRIIRMVTFVSRAETSTSSKAKAQKKPHDESLRDFVAFVRSRCGHFGMTPEGKPLKCIVHGATAETLRALQREFYKQDSTFRAVLIHDSQKAKSKSANLDLRKLGVAAEAALAPYRFEHVSEANHPTGVGVKTRVWLHQFKLLEGIDNTDFHEIFLYDGFRNARELIQQVGRALRYAAPERKTVETAKIFGALRRFDREAGSESIETVAQRQWDGYFSYEAYVRETPKRAFTAETQLLSLLKQTAPTWQYIGREFRKGFFTDENATLDEYLVPRRAVICRYLDPKQKPGSPQAHVLTDEGFDRMAKACSEAFILEDRFDMRIVPASNPIDKLRDVRLIRYLRWANSSNLRRQSIPEWNLGLMMLVRSSPFVFLLDTESLCVDFERLGLFSVSPEEMKRLFRDPDATNQLQERIRIVEASTSGLDLSDDGIRAMTIRKRNLAGGYFDLAEASQSPSALHGIAVLEDKTIRRHLSLRRGRVADPTARCIGVHDYLDWSRAVAQSLADLSTRPHSFFSRFAQEVAPPDEDSGTAENLLLDVWDLLKIDDASFQNRKWDPAVAREILDFDRCLEPKNVAGDGEKPDMAFVLGGKYPIRAKYTRRNTIPPKGRYSLSCPELDAALSTEQTPTRGTLEQSPFGGGAGNHATSLMMLVNQEQCFRVIPAAEDVVYANELFFRPSIDWQAIKTDRGGNLLDHLTVSKSLQSVVSEKGESGTTSASWPTRSQFGVVVTAFNDQEPGANDPLVSELGKSDLLICDDGSPEIADFVCVNTGDKRIILIHAKAKDEQAGVSAASLETVGRQAAASLAFIGSSRAPMPRRNHWSKPLKIRNRDSKKLIKTLQRVHARVRVTPTDAHQRVVAALSDPTYRREVWVLTSGLVSKARARVALGGTGRSRSALQFAYYLADLRTIFGRAAVGLRILTAE